MISVKWLVACILLGSCAGCVFGTCTKSNATATDPCGFRVMCVGVIKGFQLPTECQGSSNHRVHLNLTVIRALDTSDEKFTYVEQEVLKSVISFTAEGNWPKTSLLILKHMTKLEKLNLRKNNIEYIDGTPFMNNEHLQTIDLSHNRLDDLGNVFHFGAINKLNILLLSGNRIQMLYNDTFAGLSNLIELDLSYNQLTDLTQEPFAKLKSLEILHLNDNKIEELSGAFNNLTELKHLYLGGNYLKSVDEEALTILIHLVTFDVSNNKLHQLKPSIIQRHWNHWVHGLSVCKINLSNNRINSIPNNTRRFPRDESRRHSVDIMTTLDLSGNEISTVEYNAFHTILHLTQLDLSSNRLINFIVNEEDLAEIRYLNLSNNTLSSFYYNDFSFMPNLLNLDLSHNSFYYIPDGVLSQNVQLRSVNLAFNELYDLKGLRIRIFHSRGGYIDLSNNQITKIHIPKDEALHLIVLNLSNNAINDAGLVNIKETKVMDLDVSHNNISGIYSSALRLPYSLSTLDFSFNMISFIEPFSFRHLIHLKKLHLTGNRLSTIGFGTFNGLNALKTLDLSFNQIHYMDSLNLLDLKSLEELSVNYNEMNIIEYKHWINNNVVVNTYVEGNNFTCEFVSTALRDFAIGYTKMKLAASKNVQTIRHALKGIPCIPSQTENYENFQKSDDRLIYIAQSILEAVRNQTEYLKHFLWYKKNDHF